jgi:4-hydroxybenzoyl-CoA reductase subunit beta
MRLPDFNYIEPQSIKEATLFLEEHGNESKVMGGGTDLLPSMKQRIFKPKYIVYIGSISDLDQIEFNEKSGLKIGALVRIRKLEKDPIILKNYPVIARSAGEIGSVQLREMGTVGGNLCLDTRCYYYNQSDFWRKCRPKCIKMGGERCNAVSGGKKCFAVFSGDLSPVLMALDAKVKLVSSKGERIIPLSQLYTGDGAKPLSLNPNELLVGIEVPTIQDGAYTTYLKYRIRKAIDFSVASVAAMVRLNGRRVCDDVKVVIGAVGTMPEEIKAIGDLLKGKEIQDSLIEKASDLAQKEAKPISNLASSPNYRKRMIKIFVETALREAMGQSFLQ